MTWNPNKLLNSGKSWKIQFPTQITLWSSVLYLVYFFIFLFFIVVGFVIHWNESVMGLLVFPIPLFGLDYKLTIFPGGSESLDSVGEGEGGMIWENGIETCKLSYVKWITSPGWMHETSARGWCTGMTQRDGMGRELGVGFRMGNTCTPMADSSQCMVKPIQCCKVKLIN